jgi:hypothetical protein
MQGRQQAANQSGDQQQTKRKQQHVMCRVSDEAIMLPP